MTRSYRFLSIVAGGASVIALAACSGGADGNSEPTPSSEVSAAIKGFDPCTFFKPGELTSVGVSTQSEDFSPVSYEPGCKWDGEQMDLSLQKNAGETVATYSQSGSFDRYDPIQVNGRDAAIGITKGAAAQGACSTFVDAGGGVAIYSVTGMMSDSVDACAEAEKIARQTAPRLPK